MPQSIYFWLIGGWATRELNASVDALAFDKVKVQYSNSPFEDGLADDMPGDRKRKLCRATAAQVCYYFYNL